MNHTSVNWSSKWIVFKSNLNQVGNHRLKCRNGAWSGHFPVCTGQSHDHIAYHILHNCIDMHQKRSISLLPLSLSSPCQTHLLPSADCLSYNACELAKSPIWPWDVIYLLKTMTKSFPNVFTWSLPVCRFMHLLRFASFYGQDQKILKSSENIFSIICPL